MSRAGLVDHYIRASEKPGFEIDQIRKELKSKGVLEEDISSIVRLVDSHMQRQELSKSSRNKSKELIAIGGLITAVGLIVTVRTYSGIIKMGNSFILMYGPIIGGISLMLTGWVQSWNNA